MTTLTSPPTTQDRNVKVAIVELSKKRNLAYFLLTEGVNVRQPWIAVLAVGIVALAAVGSGAAGWLLGVVIRADKDTVIALAVCSGGIVGTLVGWRVLDALLDAAAASYEAEMSERPETSPGRSFLRAAVRGRTVPLSEHDKELLQVFARRYIAMPAATRTLAISVWEGANSPFVFDWLESKRKGIERVQNIVIRMGLGSRDGRGGVTLNTDGLERVVEWADGVFEDENDN